jgi:hypothetical protein
MSGALPLELVLRSARVALALACACVLGWNLVRVTRVHEPGRVALTTPGGDGVVPVPGLADYLAIARRDLFRARAGPPALPPSASAAPSTLPLRLIGTAVLSASASSSAVLQDPTTRKTTVVRVGAVIRDARIVEILPRSVLISRGGRLERIALQEPPPRPAAGRAARARLAARERLAAAVRAASRRAAEAAPASASADGPGNAPVEPTAEDEDEDEDADEDE